MLTLFGQRRYLVTGWARLFVARTKDDHDCIFSQSDPWSDNSFWLTCVNVTGRLAAGLSVREEFRGSAWLEGLVRGLH